MAKTPSQDENELAPPKSNTSLPIWAARLAFLVFLCIVAAIFGVTSYHSLRRSEIHLASEQFKVRAKSYVRRAQSDAWQRQQAVKTLARLVGSAAPNASEYPFVAVPGWKETAEELAALVGDEDYSYTPIVYPEDLAEFEAFAVQYFQESGVPEEEYKSSFGVGTWAIIPTLDTDDKRYHDTTGWTFYGSPYRILVPSLQKSASARSSSLLFNFHFLPFAGHLMDATINATDARQLDTLVSGMDTVQSIADEGPVPVDEDFNAEFSNSIVNAQVEHPRFTLVHPVYPSQSPLTPVGFVLSGLSWNQVLDKLFSEEISGFDCVIETNGQALTYRIQEGEPILRGTEKLFESHHAGLGQSGVLIKASHPASHSYNITIYPTDELLHSNQTNKPIVQAIVSVAIIIFTAAVFFGYDFLVRKEFQSKKQLLDAKRHFVRYVSHEVRTPLNSVCMGLTLIQEEIAATLGFASGNELKRNFLTDSPSSMPSSIDKNIRRWFVSVQDVLDAAEVSVNVLNDMLNYDKIERGELKLELTVVKIWRLIQETVDEFRMAAAKKSHKFDFCFVTLDGARKGRLQDLPSRMRRQGVIGDDIRLKQVLRNLLSNAIKFTPEEGSISVRAVLKPGPSVSKEKTFKVKTGDKIRVNVADVLQVEVEDTGAGMSPEQLTKLYTAGTQFNKNKLQGGQGSGLGLFITNGIVKQHEGTLEATSSGLGLGTTFSLRLPLYCSVSISGPSVTPSSDMVTHKTFFSSLATSAVEANEKRPMRLLIVDDVLSNRKLLSRLLSHHGHQCDLAGDGEEAIRMITEAIEAAVPYHSILLDYEMPVMNGPDAAKEMRRRKFEPCFIIGVTGNMLPDDVNYFRECGANAVLAKPFQYAKVEEVWDKHGVRSLVRV